MNISLIVDHVQNEVLAVELSSSRNVEETIYQGYNISATEMEEVTASEAEMTIDKTLLGSVVFQLRPLTDQAAQNLLDAKTNNKLVKMVCGILKQVKIPEMKSGSKPLEIKVQVCYARSTKPKEGKVSLFFKIIGMPKSVKQKCFKLWFERFRKT